MAATPATAIAHWCAKFPRKLTLNKSSLILKIFTSPTQLCVTLGRNVFISYFVFHKPGTQEVTDYKIQIKFKLKVGTTAINPRFS